MTETFLLLQSETMVCRGKNASSQNRLQALMTVPPPRLSPDSPITDPQAEKLSLEVPSKKYRIFTCNFY